MHKVAAYLEELRGAIWAFPYAPSTLVPDITLVGFGVDVLESAAAAMELAETDLPHRGFPNARAAFESAQQVLLLSTDENYELAGARAWVHYVRRDANLLADACTESSGIKSDADADRWYRHKVHKMAAIWNSISPGQGRFMLEADRILSPSDRHWLGVNVPKEIQRRYELLARVLGNRVPSDSVDLNRSLYTALSRETHARWRLDAFAVSHQPGGTIQVHFQARNTDASRRSVLGTVESALFETILGFAYQLAMRAA